MSDHNGVKHDPERDLAELRKLMAELRELEERNEQQHKKRMRQIKASAWFSFLLLGIGAGMMLVSAILNFIARFWP